MKKYCLYILFCFFSLSLFSQSSKTLKPKAYSYYINVLTNAKDSLYKSIIKQYDNYLKEHPRDIQTCIEKCRVMENAYYDAGEDYNPKYDECQAYLDSLTKIFPDEPELMIYRSESLYGDSAIAFCKRVVDHYNDHRDVWKDKNIWMIYEKLSNSYSYEDNSNQCIKYGLLAVESNDTLDLSVTLAQQYQTLNKNEKAIAILLKHIDSTESGWILNQKGKLLLELGEFNRALILLKWAKKDTSLEWSNNSVLAEAMIENGFYEEARTYLVKDSKNKWNESTASIKLFDYDIKYSSGDSAHASYRRMVNAAYMNDPVGVKRIRLFFKSPFQPWYFYDILKLLLLLVSLVAVFFIPYLWLLPIHFIGNHYKKKGKIYSQSEFRWSLRHFWIACSLLLITDVIANLIFDHDNFFGVGSDEKEKLISANIAHMTLFIFVAYAALTILLLKRSDLKLFFGNLWSKQKSFFMGVGYALLLRVGLTIYLGIYNLIALSERQSPFLSIADNVASVNNYYHPILGFLLVVIIVPIYEEILFRGVFLSASEKYMKFFWANTLQAVLFATVHLDPKLFVFYLAFGYVAGYQKRKSQALATGIFIHITNNLLAFFVILLYR